VLSAVLLLSACDREPARDSRAPERLPPRAVTFNQDVAPILFTECAGCHRPVTASSPAAAVGRDGSNEVICIAGAPFQLLTYADARARATRIAAVTKNRTMPPWLPDGAHGEFVNERRLTDAQIALIQQWVEQGTPEGDGPPPPPPVWPEGWQLGTPDLVLTLADAYTLRSDQGDVFRNFVVPVPVGSADADFAPRYVRAIEFRADNPRVLHHANVALDPTRVGRGLDRRDAGPGFATMPEGDVQNVYGWSPGKAPVLEPADTAWALEAGSDLVVQLHMVSRGRAETVRPSLGLFFSATPPTRVPLTIKLESKSIDIPAGDANYVVRDSYVLPADVDLISIYPHAHYLATTMRGAARLPDGTVRTLLTINRWDVRWQDQYRYTTPLFLPKGTTVTMEFAYDNSTANTHNPQRPPVRVLWGPKSTDEMGALWLEVVTRRQEDADVLAREFFSRELRADTAAAELRAKSDSTNPAAHNALALKYMAGGRLDEAERELQDALRLQPMDAEAHSNFGTLLLARGRFSDGLAHLEQAARLKPDDDRIRVNLGNGRHAGGDVSGAVAEYRRAVKLNPENGDAHFNLAVLLGPQGHLDEAIAHLRRTLTINPRNAEAHRNLSIALGLTGRLEEAITHARAALSIDPQSPSARQQLDQLLARQSVRP
jgi:tetratricopeptide (TPR) repeat protein